MKQKAIPRQVFVKHYASTDGVELRSLAPRDFYVFQFIKVYAGPLGEFGPVEDCEMVALLNGKLSLRSFRDARDSLAELGRINLRRTHRGLIYGLSNKETDKNFLRKVKKAEEQLGVDAPDCLVQMAVAPISKKVKRARWDLAKQRAEGTA